MCSLSRNGLLSLLVNPPICQAVGFSRYGFIYLKICCLDLSDAVGFKICCRLYVICCPALCYMLPGFNNILSRLPIDAIRPCIYLACCLRKRLIFLFRLATDWLLAAIIKDCTLPELSLGVGSAKSSQTATWTPGNWVL